MKNRFCERIVTFFGDLVPTGVGIVFTREIGANAQSA